MEEENRNEKPVSNKKAIISIIVVIALLAILGIVYATMLKPKEDTCDSIRNINKRANNINEMVKKPIIYIYPTEKIKVNIKVGKPENLTHTYPKYEDGWKVIAKPNGDLTDLKQEEIYMHYIGKE